MFGTFQREEEKPTYGLTSNISTFNPLIIATHEWWVMFKDTLRNPRHAWGYIFGPPGWSHDGSRKTTAQLRAGKGKVSRSEESKPERAQATKVAMR